MNEIQTPPPIQILDSTAKEQGGAGVRDFLLIVAALPALIAVVGKGDALAIVSYIASIEFAPVLAVLVLGGTVIWRQLLTRWAKRKYITVGQSADDTVATVIQK